MFGLQAISDSSGPGAAILGLVGTLIVGIGGLVVVATAGALLFVARKSGGAPHDHDDGAARSRRESEKAGVSIESKTVPRMAGFNLRRGATGWAVVALTLVIFLAAIAWQLNEDEVLPGDYIMNKTEIGSLGGVVREGIGPDYAAVSTLSPGETVVILGNFGQETDGFPWFRVRFAGSEEGFHWGGSLCARLHWVNGLSRRCPAYRLPDRATEITPLGSERSIIDQLDNAFELLLGTWQRVDGDELLEIRDGGEIAHWSGGEVVGRQFWRLHAVPESRYHRGDVIFRLSEPNISNADWRSPLPAGRSYDIDVAQARLSLIPVCDVRDFKCETVHYRRPDATVN